MPRSTSGHDPIQGQEPVKEPRALVSIVDDAQSIRESLPDLMRQFGFTAQAFSSAQAFLASPSVSETRCLVLDIAMPGMSGLELWRELKSRGREIPTIFITATGDPTIRPRLLSEGAVDCLFKPINDVALIAALNVALELG
jgi:FixJ family two-component response regulator